MRISIIMHLAAEKLSALLSTVPNRIRFRFNGAKLGKNSWFRGKVYIKNFGSITAGDNLRVRSGPKTAPCNRGEGVYLCTFGKDATITIGNNVGMSNCSILSSSSISIGDNVCIGTGTCIMNSDHHPLDSSARCGVAEDKSKITVKPIVIEEGVFIGMGATILKGAVIGKNSVVGAMSVVSGKIPDGQIWAGNPARYIRDVKPKVEEQTR